MKKTIAVLTVICILAAVLSAMLAACGEDNTEGTKPAAEKIVMPTDNKGETVYPTDNKGYPAYPTDNKGEPVFATDSKGGNIYAYDGDGNAITSNNAGGNSSSGVSDNSGNSNNSGNSGNSGKADPTTKPVLSTDSNGDPVEEDIPEIIATIPDDEDLYELPIL